MKVLVADDNAIVRLGVRAILEQIGDVTEVIEAVDGVQALEITQSDQPDVVLLDVRMPRRSGLDVLVEIAATARVLMLTHSDEPEIIRAALTGGALGYLVHGQITVDQLAGAIRTCHAGGMVLSKEAVAFMTVSGPAAPRPAGNAALRSKLTAREIEVMDAAARGLDNADIAREHFLSPRTVKNYLNSAYAKIGVHNRSEAIVLWLEGEGPPL